MSSKTNILVDISDPSLREDFAVLLASDWTNSWNMLDAKRNPQFAATAQIAVVDSEAALALFNRSASVVFFGSSSDESKIFERIDASAEKPADEIFRAVKKAHAYRETTRQNIESLYPIPEKGSPLESVAHILSERLHELQRLSDMRLSLIEQLPMGVIGIDDEGAVVLANPKALELLGLQAIPVWGMSVAELLEGKADALMAAENEAWAEIVFKERRLILGKSPFLLENSPAGVILTISEPYIKSRG
jgi:PAS domain-containing protein